MFLLFFLGFSKVICREKHQYILRGLFFTHNNEAYEFIDELWKDLFDEVSKTSELSTPLGISMDINRAEKGVFDLESVLGSNTC